jgi:hypothetical protein
MQRVPLEIAAMSTLPFVPGGYSFIPGVFQYSGGVVTQPGFAIERVRFHKPVALADGFERIAGIIRGAGRPLAAFCACELRSPEPFSEAGFRAFNELYVGTLARWGVYDGTTNPVARSNVCPEIGKPAGPSFYAFAYTVPALVRDAPASFIVAGSAECPEGQSNYRDHIIAPGDTSATGLKTKAQWVLGEMERRMAALGQSWVTTTATQAYTVHNLQPFLREEIVRRGAARAGLTWHDCRPPVAGLDYEMDCRGVRNERVVD